MVMTDTVKSLLGEVDVYYAYLTVVAERIKYVQVEAKVTGDSWSSGTETMLLIEKDMIQWKANQIKNQCLK